MAKKILPEPGKKNILITSALPYVNNVPHLGNIIGSVLSADAFSKYCKARPDTNALYICGTDEYGTATETAALAAGISCEELCRHYNKIHAQIYEWFGIEFDIFGRTPTPQHTEIAQEFFLKLQKSGCLEERTTQQPYCESHHSYLADRFIEGECPLCQYPDARGDQCDKCGNLLDPVQLVNPRCKVDGARPVLRDTKHVFLLLDKLQPEIEKWARKSSKDGAWSANSVSITESWFKLGLHARGVTRDLKWGVPVPLPGYENKVMYVWLEACIGYVSICANYTDEWRKWWRNPEQVKLYQFMGKDNVPFHSVIFPGCQIGTGDGDWTQLHHLSTTEYLNYEGGKFSKSRGIGVFGDKAKETGIPSDVFRYYLLYRRPESQDTDFDWKSLIDSNNNELLKNLGNLCNRVMIFTVKNYDSTVPDYTTYKSESLDKWKAEVNESLAEYNELFEAVKIKQALTVAMRIAGLGNKLLQTNTLDNQTLKSQPDKIAATVGTCLNLLHLLAGLIRPFMPATSSSICSQLDVEGVLIPDEWSADTIKPGHKVGEAKKLFEPIKPEMEQMWREQFGGDEARRQREEKAAKAAKKKADKEKKKQQKLEAKEGGATAAAAGAAAGGSEALPKPKNVETEDKVDEAQELAQQMGSSLRTS